MSPREEYPSCARCSDEAPFFRNCKYCSVEIDLCAWHRSNTGMCERCYATFRARGRSPAPQAPSPLPAGPGDLLAGGRTRASFPGRLPRRGPGSGLMWILWAFVAYSAIAFFVGYLFLRRFPLDRASSAEKAPGKTAGRAHGQA